MPANLPHHCYSGCDRLQVEAFSEAEAIRKAARQIGGEKVRREDVIALLAVKGIEVAPAQVSATLKSAGDRPLRRRKPADLANGHHTSVNGYVSIEHLIAAKALADQLGGLEAAMNALNALAK